MSRPGTRKSYRLGGKVEVQVVRVDLERRQIDFALVDVLERARGSRNPLPGGPRGGEKAAARGRPRRSTRPAAGTALRKRK